jgi:hypothetical protein
MGLNSDEMEPDFVRKKPSGGGGERRFKKKDSWFGKGKKNDRKFEGSFKKRSKDK